MKIRKKITRLLSWLAGLSLGSFLFTLLLAILVVAVFVRTEFFQQALRDRVVAAVEDTIQAEIDYESAAVHVFRLFPRLIFNQVRITDPQTEVDVEIDEISVSISLFISLPMLLFQEIYIHVARVQGLRYELRSLDVVDEWLSRIQPEGSDVTAAFRTRIRRIDFRDFELGLDLEQSSRLARALSGDFFLEQFVVDLDGDDFWLNGRFRFKNFVSEGFQLDTGQLEIEDTLITKAFARFDRVFLESGEDFIELSGQVRDWDDPQYDLRLRSSADIRRYIPDSPADGRFRAVGNLQGRWREWTGVLDIEAQPFIFRGRGFDRVNIRTELDRSAVRVERLELVTGAEQITGSLSYNTELNRLDALALDLQAVRLGEVLKMIDEDKESWGGVVTGQIQLREPADEGVLALLSAELQVEGFEVRNSEADFIYGAPPSLAQVDLDLVSPSEGSFTTSVSNAGGEWSGGANWSPGNFRIFWDGEMNGRPQGRLFQFDLEVLGRVSGYYGGPVDRMIIDMDLDFAEFRMNEHLFRGLNGKMRFVDRVLFADPIEFEGGRTTGGLFFPKDQPTEFKDFSFDMSQHRIDSILNSLEETREWKLKPIGNVTGSGTLNGWIGRPSGSGVLLVRDLRFENDRARGRLAKSNWRFSEGVFFLENVFVETSREAGGISGDMSFLISGLRHFNLRGREVRLGDWFAISGLDFPLQSFAHFESSYQKDTDQLRLQMDLYESFVNGQAQESSRLNLQISENQIQLTADLFGRRLRASVNDRISREIEATVSFRGFHPLHFSSALAGSGLDFGLRGDGLCRLRYAPNFSSLSAYAKLTSLPQDYQCDIAFRESDVKRGNTTLHQIKAFDLNVSGTPEALQPRLQTSSIQLTTEGSILEASGFFRSAKDLNIRLQGEVGIDALAYGLSTLSRAEGSMRLDGRWEASGYSGLLRLTDAALFFEDRPISVRQLQAQLNARNSRFDIVDLSGQFREGGVVGTGWFALDGFSLSNASVNLQLNGPVIEPERGVRFQASGPLQIRVGEQSQITGELNVYNSSYRKRINLRSDLMNFFQRRRTSRFNFFDEEPSPFDAWNLDIGLNSTDPVLIRNNLADGSVHLRMRVQGQIGQPRLVGSIQILQGSFNYFNRNFVVQSGSVQFTDTSSNIPRYEIRAEAEVDIYRVFVTLIGDSNEQKIIYSSDPPLQEKEILALVSYGTPPVDQDNIREDDATSSAAFTGISFFTGQLQDTIEGALATDLGIQRFQLYPAFFQETGKTELQLKIGTDLIRNRLQLNYYNFVSVEGGHQVELDLRINRNVSLVGSWRDSTQTQDRAVSGDLGSDLIFRFEVE